MSFTTVRLIKNNFTKAKMSIEYVNCNLKPKPCLKEIPDDVNITGIQKYVDT